MEVEQDGNLLLLVVQEILHQYHHLKEILVEQEEALAHLVDKVVEEEVEQAQLELTQLLIHLDLEETDLMYLLYLIHPYLILEFMQVEVVELNTDLTLLHLIHKV